MKSRVVTTKIVRPPSRGRGRPREFDRDQALGIAQDLFWRHGYEGVSITDLTQAMGVSPTSLYAAFGAKADLYREALERYRRQEGAFDEQVLGLPGTAREAVAALLRECAARFTEPGHPPGCMVSSSALACAEEHRAVAQDLARRRAGYLRALTQRIRRGAEGGELPPDTDCEALATFYGAVIHGMSVLARDGADGATLGRVAELAAGAWETLAARATG